MALHGSNQNITFPAMMSAYYGPIISSPSGGEEASEGEIVEATVQPVQLANYTFSANKRGEMVEFL